MTILSHILGFPRIGLQRELKKSLEQYWNKNISQCELLSVGRALRIRHWQQQKDSGLDFVSVGDFAWYDHVLTTSLMLNNVPNRFWDNARVKDIDIDLLFNIARGITDVEHSKMVVASEMKKWFNTNYHYIVPEFFVGQTFQLSWMQLFDEVDEALALGYKVKVTLLGPISYLWLGKMKEVSNTTTRLSLLPQLLLVYQEILNILSKKGIEWVQIDEPILVLELPVEWCEVYFNIYKQMCGSVKLLLTTYFDSIIHNINVIEKIPVDGLHVDLVAGNDSLDMLHSRLPNDWVLSVGVVNGRNIWRSNLQYWFNKLFSLIGKRIMWVGSSCSLLHVPIDLCAETLLNIRLKKKLSFALQKCAELKKLCDMLNNSSNVSYVSSDIQRGVSCFNSDESNKVDSFVFTNRLDYDKRVCLQNNRFCLPICPTTTIGSFPQTFEIRTARLEFKCGRLDQESYHTIMKKYIQDIIIEQEKLGLDVLVHGEPERSDMVEYFAEHLNGFALTSNGWVQSYGSRCVKPPIIFDTVSRSSPITVEWVTYAQSLTNKPVKGMLTGPVTILYWSFSREDITRQDLALEIALAIRSEVYDLEKNGIGIIQIDEPALREGLPLKLSFRKKYLSWSVKCFKLITAAVSNDVQIHTHMCYSEFSDIIYAIVDMDVDVLSIEFSRVDISSLCVLKNFYLLRHAIGPGVYDIHSPNIPDKVEVFNRLVEMVKYIDIQRLWVNPDCGLKTRSWVEIRKSLFNIVSAVQEFRKVHGVN